MLLGSNSNFNSSINFNLKPESFSENYIPIASEKDNNNFNTIAHFKESIDSKNITMDDIKNLRTRFDKVYQKLKKTADTQENYLSKIASEENKNTIERNLKALNTSSSLLLEDEPKRLFPEKDKKNIDYPEKSKTELYKMSLSKLEEENSFKSNEKSQKPYLTQKIEFDVIK